ncbi:hypothetical protein QBC38DRAFT_491197 [Podospora fimiseda]|uniref:FAS1 domain-containing protein n=1 Tax=Podospora fimiseda TaxID=252190 RepID=A0AAN6YMA8_9PEZI|nr:hypothetical protein QBC38DRAFT_491197 [Podospora fimiseda]
MVSIRSLTAVSLASFLFWPLAVLAVTSSTVVDNFAALKAKSIALQDPAQNVNLINAYLFIAGLGPIPSLISQYKEFIVLTDGLNAAYLGSPPFTSSDATAATIPSAFRAFIVEHSILLNILIGNAGVVNPVPGVGVLPPLNTAMGTVLSAGRTALETYTARIVALTDATADFQIQESWTGINTTYNVAYDFYRNSIVTDVLG